MSGKKPDPLPARFRDLKLRISKGKEDALQQSWTRLLASLKEEVDEVRERGSEVSCTSVDVYAKIPRTSELIDEIQT